MVASEGSFPPISTFLAIRAECAHLASLATRLLTVTIVGCNAVVGTEPVQYRDDLDSESPAAALTCESRGHTQRFDGDGGAPSTIHAQCASVVIDKTACTVNPADVGLSLGLDGHGWAVSASDLSCFGGASLIIQGVDDAPYPQTAVQPFLSEESVWLATRDDSDPYSSHPSGFSTIDDGPSKSDGARTIGAVKGSARVVSKSGAARDVTFEFSF